MKISNEIRHAINLCLRHAIPFVAFAAPSERRIVFRSSLGETNCSDCEYFFINTFASPLKDIIRIPFIANEYLTIEALEERPTDICKESTPEMPASTSYIEYAESVGSVIEELKANGGKTVISRTISGSAPGIDWIEFAHKYFTALPLTYRFIYYTPSTGAWIVATPELLYSYDKQNRTSHTMALAGTRECTGDSLPWDEKNTHEHALVADYISSKLKQAGLEPKITGPHTSHFGKIEHLCTSFDIFDKHLSEDRVFSIIDALNPTPAVAGYPKETAIASIGRVEKHNRSCYGGYIGLSTDKSYTAVVNLRCLSFTSDKYCIYAGGGIMPESNIQNEWDETEAKSALARSIIKDLSSR